MQASFIRKCSSVPCLALFLILSPLCGAQDKPPSVLSRVQAVDEPDLGELLRVALERPRGEEEMLQTVRVVTESYAQIRLMDRQIEQIEQRMASTTGPSELRHELMLAQAELESKRLAELAHLRQVMGIIPKYPLGRKAVWNLKTWLTLDVLDSRVYVVESLQPFSSQEERMTRIAVGLMSAQGAIQHIEERIRDRDQLPIRIDIHRTSGGVRLSEEIRDRIVVMVKKSGLAMEAEVHLDESVQQHPHVFAVSVKNGRVQLIANVGRGQSIAQLQLDDIDGFMGGFLAKPENVPAQFQITYSAHEWQLVERVTASMEEAAHRLGIGDFVEIVQNAEGRGPESLYLGRWRGEPPDRVAEVEILQGHGARVTDAAGTSEGRWTLGGSAIVLRIGKETHEGHIDSEGNFILTVVGQPVMLKKVQ